MFLGCFQSVKDIKFESNSQPYRSDDAQNFCCFQSVKDIKFESNSQPKKGAKIGYKAVSSLSKI